MLEIVAPGDSGFVLAQGAFTSNDHSVLKNREAVYWPASRWVIRELAAARRGGEAGYQQRLALRQLAPFPGAAGAGREPSLPGAAWQFLRAAMLRPIKRRVLERTTRDQWVLMFAFSGASNAAGSDRSDSDQAAAFADKPEMSLQEFRLLRPPIDRFWADPCVIAHQGRWWVFFEELVYAENKGVLAVLEIFSDGTWSTPQRILELPCHLSYPFVFEHHGQFYMVPETLGQRSIDLYRAIEFPFRWQKQRTLIDDIAAVDATLIEHAGRWWLFANVVADPHLTTQDELWLFSTDDPIEGTWLPHAGNPVVADAMSARPAGRLWRERTASGSRLLRPSQNSAWHYGYALQIQEVLQLDDADFREVCVTQIKPGWQPDIVGVHTLSFAGGLTVIDALVHHSRIHPSKLSTRGPRP